MGRDFDYERAIGAIEANLRNNTLQMERLQENLLELIKGQTTLAETIVAMKEIQTKNVIVVEGLSLRMIKVEGDIGHARSTSADSRDASRARRSNLASWVALAFSIATNIMMGLWWLFSELKKN